jgi:hypothetical protein
LQKHAELEKEPKAPQPCYNPFLLLLLLLLQVVLLDQIGLTIETDLQAHKLSNFSDNPSIFNHQVPLTDKSPSKKLAESLTFEA